MSRLIAAPAAAPAAEALDVYWPDSTLDIEPEQSWCLACGEEQPCGCAATSTEPVSGKLIA